jgi:hypothetical protein
VVVVDLIRHHQQMDYLVVLGVVVVIILATDLVDLELLAKEIPVVLDIGCQEEHTMEVVVAVLVLLVVMEDLLMVMLDLVVMVFKFLQHLEIQLLLQAIPQIHLLHKEVVV